MAEMYFLCWQAREIDGYVPVTARGAAGQPEFYLEPIQIHPRRRCAGWRTPGEEPVARYDGLAWRRPREG